jgi:hypothetical protein
VVIFLYQNINTQKDTINSWAPVAHVYNPSYSRGRDQKDCGLKPATASSSGVPIQEKHPTNKKGWPNGSNGRMPD